jgi:hypothetical protein
MGSRGLVTLTVIVLWCVYSRGAGPARAAWRRCTPPRHWRRCARAAGGYLPQARVPTARHGASPCPPGMPAMWASCCSTNTCCQTRASSEATGDWDRSKPDPADEPQLSWAAARRRPGAARMRPPHTAALRILAAWHRIAPATCMPSDAPAARAMRTPLPPPPTQTARVPDAMPHDGVQLTRLPAFSHRLLPHPPAAVPAAAVEGLPAG